MSHSIYQVDAFTKDLFSGNPAAVVPLQDWLPDDKLRSIAKENNLSETAFFTVVEPGLYELRWFTPKAEVDLCGHATLATAHVLWEELGAEHEELIFETRQRGRLKVTRKDDLIKMNLPGETAEEVPPSAEIAEALGHPPAALFKGKTDYMAVYNTQAEVLRITPNFEKLAQTDARGVIITSLGEAYDFVSRFFAPAFGINEDPVTGSAHCLLAPFWSTQLGINTFVAKQVSERGGELICTVEGNRVIIAGRAVTYMSGSLRF